jgi:hypothetical protein
VAGLATQGQLVTLGCRAHQTVAVAAQVEMTRVILEVMAPWVGTVGVVSSPLVRSCGGANIVDVTPHVSKPHDYVNHMFMRP